MVKFVRAGAFPALTNLFGKPIMTAKVILNPYSNRWKARERWPIAEKALRAVGFDFELEISEGPGFINGLAEKAALDGFSPIVAAGGDGTVGEVVNGLVRAAGSPDSPLPILGILPVGTANDFAQHAIGLSLDLSQAAQTLAAGKTRQVDLGQVNERYFINNTALGLEPYITLIQDKIGWIKGVPRYLLAAVRGILDRPSWNVDMEWDGGSYSGPISLVYIGNGGRSGGVFYMSPHANPSDGNLTIVHGYRASRLGMFHLLPKAMKPGPGSYVESPGMSEFHTNWLKVKLDRPSPAHADGDVFSTAIQQLTYCIHPGRISVLVQ
jgi:diacylglycerol kinase (ATP)